MASYLSGALNDPIYADVVVEICDLNRSSGLRTPMVNDENSHNNRSSPRKAVWGVADRRTLANLSNLVASIPSTSRGVGNNENGIRTPTTRHNAGGSGIRKPLLDLSILVGNTPHTTRSGLGACKRPRTNQTTVQAPGARHTPLRDTGAKRHRAGQSASSVLNDNVLTINNVYHLGSDARTSPTVSSTSDNAVSFADWDEDLISAWDACDFELPTPSPPPSESTNVQETHVESVQTTEVVATPIIREDDDSEDELSPSVLPQTLEALNTTTSDQAPAVVPLEDDNSVDTGLSPSVLPSNPEDRSSMSTEHDPEVLPGNQQAYRNELVTDEQTPDIDGNAVTLKEIKDFLHYVWSDYVQFKQFVATGFSNMDTEQRSLFVLNTEIVTLLKNRFGK
ncbi:uncharacterized protein [Misgurnus anguillicaudatus]|uniref:uncharacterized protein n=1 Tax=Misgurnus anguillicaudatus TaxID=75329 RepID=UPI003CCF3069